jgi:hypothetical protein
MSFTPANRQITINALDRPDAVPHPQRDPIGYDTGTRMTAPLRRPRLPFGVFLVGTATVLLVGSVVLWRLMVWLGDEYRVHDQSDLRAPGAVRVVSGAHQRWRCGCRHAAGTGIRDGGLGVAAAPGGAAGRHTHCGL